MNNNYSMVDWCSSWALVGGNVVCVSCMKWQTLSKAHEDFPHDLTCRVKDELTPYPWVELHQILDNDRG